ncbi:hypothetical protein QFZ56_007701 [Streptomyces achromogenes]|uniref:Integrase n=1 Tax=Streptomyces achromogenes TaxID=67255 RepID=A0ABU0QG90_STRAH|nr:hypothetical protein [Streptomyces achromogenes]
MPGDHEVGALRRERKWPAARIAFELAADGIPISRRTATRHLWG